MGVREANNTHLIIRMGVDAILQPAVRGSGFGVRNHPPPLPRGRIYISTYISTRSGVWVRRSLISEFRPIANVTREDGWGNRKRILCKGNFMEKVGNGEKGKRGRWEGDDL